MFCANCGTRLEDDALFCTECGASITRRTPGALGQVTGSGTAGEHTMSQTDSLPRPVPAKSRRHHRLLVPIFALAFIVVIAIIVVRVLDGGRSSKLRPLPPFAAPLVLLRALAPMTTSLAGGREVSVGQRPMERLTSSILWTRTRAM